MRPKRSRFILYEGAEGGSYIVGNKNRGVSLPFLTSKSYSWAKLIMLFSVNNVAEDRPVIYGLFLFKGK